MEAVQETERGSIQKAKRLLPLEQFDPDELEEMAGDAAAGLIRSGDVQYWQFNGTYGVFTQSTIVGVWQFEVHFDEAQGGEDPASEVKSVLTAFWDAQQPEYITANSATAWPVIWLMQAAGFHQVGVLPLSEGPVISWGWRKCH